MIPEHKNEIYNKEFYERSGKGDRLPSYKVIAKYICRTFQPKTVIDFGCGCGWVLYYLKRQGMDCCNLYGIEPSDAAPKVQPDSEISRQILPGDLRKPLMFPRMSKRYQFYDLALCIEVAEHIDDEYSDMLIDNITYNTDTLIFSAAYPGQGGVDHKNEQPWIYWILKFSEFGFLESEKETEKMKEFLIKNKVKSWYSQNMRVLRRVNGI